ncbi:MAG TPA: dihydrolipoamide acetyltransferase family protein [Prolixibacteraceae bacterium]|nr:dihydrolipoamide acetyltransferase family protein [Prolixibacteraceae bacterium]
MATAIIMPRQGQSVESCIITEMYKQKGDRVSVGDLLFAYETDKASFEEESPVEGVVLELFFREGDEVPVLSNVLVIGAEGEAVDEFQTENSPEKSEAEAEVKVKAEVEVEVEAEVKAAMTVGKSVGISPRAKNLAVKKGLDVSLLNGSGPGGRIIEQDVRAAAERLPRVSPLARMMQHDDPKLVSATGSGLSQTVKGADLSQKQAEENDGFDVKPLTNIRKLIAKAMFQSLQNSAQLTHHLGADARNILEIRNKVKIAVEKGYPENITLNDMICFAAIRALKKFPQVNAHFLGDSMKIFHRIHLGMAVDTDRGLMVPVIRNADELTLPELSVRMKELAAACRKGSVNPELLASDAASFTVSNLGNYGVEMFTPVINLPQVAILGVNTIVPRPKDLGNGVYAFVPYLGLSLTYDHRALDGGEATRFVKQVAIEIENLEFDV